MFNKEERVSSFMDKAQKKLAEKKTKESMKIIENGMNHYSNKILKAIQPYAANDAGLLIVALRHIADEVERNNPGAGKVAAGFEKCLNKPVLSEVSKVKKPNSEG